MSLDKLHEHRMPFHRARHLGTVMTRCHRECAVVTVHIESWGLINEWAGRRPDGTEIGQPGVLCLIVGLLFSLEISDDSTCA